MGSGKGRTRRAQSKATSNRTSINKVPSHPLEDEDGITRWYTDDGELHREDGPAVIRQDGSKEWWQYDQIHRVDGPAVERADGTKAWYQDDKPHRVDGPAVEYIPIINDLRAF